MATISRESPVRQSDLAPLEELVDHVRGRPGSPTILMYGDYECPHTRKAYLAIQRVERRTGGEVRFAFRHFPLSKHPHALIASAAAEAASRQGHFWEMSDILLNRQDALTADELRSYAAELALDISAFDRDRRSNPVLARISRDVSSGLATGVRGTPTLFIDGARHVGPYSARPLLDALAALASPGVDQPEGVTR